MEITDSFLTLLQNFAPVFTAPTYQTFVVIVTGWIISQRHRYVTEVIFSSGRVGDGHWSRFHRFFSHAAWDIDTFSMRLAKLVVTILAPERHLLLGRRRHPLSQTRADPLRRRHALRPPHLQSRQIPGQLGTRLGRADPDRRLPPLGTVQSLRLAHRHVLVPQPPRADQGEKESKGKKGQQKPAKPKHDPNHRTRRELALELIIMVAQWFPNEEIIVSGDSAYGGQSILSTCRPTFTSSAMCIPMEHSTSRRLQERKTQRTGPQERGQVARHEAMGRRSGPTVDETRV